MPTFTAPDGLQLVFDAFETPHPRAAVLVIHGWSDHGGRWTETADALKQKGYSAYLLDLRG
ncbi:MAG TPA: alpha/beta hydrolase, partial [Gemmatimonadales bacterium]|nr:alpha/beta hydrolase [Gemmatimonadales bacterium]